MRILFIVSHYYPRLGGVEYVVKSIAERLAKMGHIVVVLCGEPKIENPTEEWINDVKVVRWPTWSPGDAYHIPKSRHRLARWLQEARAEYEFIHIHSIHSVLSIYCLNVLKGAKDRMILTPYYHGSGHTLFRRILWKGWRLYVKRLLKYVDIIHTVSKLEANLVMRDFTIEAKPIENGVDEWVLNISRSPSNYVMYSGRIEKYKNIQRLANVVKILNFKYGLDLEMKIFGEGPFTDPLINLLNRMGVKYGLNPPQPFEEYIELLSKASMLGLLSEKESYPQSINEANAIGTPVVVVEPWGTNFLGRNRTLITQLDKKDEDFAREIVIFLEECKNQQKSKVPSWNEVTDSYLKYLYK